MRSLLNYTTSLALALGLLLTYNACQKSPAAAAESSVPAEFLLAVSDLPDYEQEIDHASMIEAFDDHGYTKGERIYNNTCFNCHGNPGQAGSIPNAHKFWEDTYKYAGDPYGMYQTISRGLGRMPAQVQLVPQEKYAVIQFIYETYARSNPSQQDFKIDEAYLASLPPGTQIGPEPKIYQPWAEMNYGDFWINTFELAGPNAPEREISGGPSPLPNENYQDLNFAYKGIVIRLDQGEGGVAAGKAWALFDHDLMRLTGIWTGDKFIDWEGILLNDRHNIYPRTLGKVHVENPLNPAWANPQNGSFEDPRFRAIDGRPFGPLPKNWAHYLGLYHHEEKVVLAYTVGDGKVLEAFELETEGENPIFSRTLNVQAGEQALVLRLAPDTLALAILSENAQLQQKNGFHQLRIAAGSETKVKVLMAESQKLLDSQIENIPQAEDLSQYTQGAKTRYPEILTSELIAGTDTAAYAVDILSLPIPNPWRSRMRPGGIDFYPDGERAVLCTIEGEVWEVSGITQKSGELKWKRIATGMYQPLGIKIHEGKIYVSCRDQIVRLQDLNGDGETDYYESFNNDHQVTEHFHEFAMGLQVDEKGNFYYAKSARHARTPLVPQHGTLLRVSADGERTDIVAHGFRAANGVCRNPDGSFYVTDQEGHWNPMNRINLVEEGKFYGNMYGYGAPDDTSNSAMVSPLVWVDQKNDRSPSELVWVESEKWGPLEGSLLNLSYGYGKIFVLLKEEKEGQPQAGIVELPVGRFPTGIMRARFNPKDGQMYAIGMNAWGSSQVYQNGGFYRIRYTGNDLNLPIKLQTHTSGINLTFANELDPASVAELSNFEIETWQLKRTHFYGSKRYDAKKLKVAEANLMPDGKTIRLAVPEIDKTWIMEIRYQLKDSAGRPFEGFVQNTIYELSKEAQSLSGR
ncbi:MAG: DUF6797 domain-containing protein [Bacteroidota bacterium]